MADLNQQAQELAEIMERVNEEMRRYGRITEETSEALKAGSDKRAKELKAGGAAAAEALAAVAKAGMASASAMYRGEKGAAAFNDSLDEMSKAATAAGVALTFLIPGGPAIKLLVGAVTAATAGLVAYTKAANEMADKLYKGYSGMAKSGAAASDGMTGLYNDAKKLGLSMNELDGFVSLVGENSKDLALFGGTVFEGRKKFAELGNAMEGSREEFFRLGMSQEEQNKAIMGYTRLQTQLGRTQGKSVEEMADAAKKYIYEQDALTKLTGMAREEQEKAREEIRSQERFRAKLLELEQQGRHQEAKELENAYLVLRSQSKEAAQGFADISTNNVQTEAAQKSIMATQGESMRAAQLISEGQIKGIEAVQMVGEATGRTATELGATMGQIGTYNQTFGDLNDSLKLGMFARNDLEAQYNKVIADQEKARTGTGDQLVNNQAQLIKTQQDANKATEAFVFQGIAPAQKAMIGLAEATRDAANKLNDMTGKKGEYGKEGSGTMAGSLAATGAGAAAGAIIGSVVPVIGTAIGGAIGGAMGFLGYELFGGDAGAEKAATQGAAAEAKPEAKGRAGGSLGATGKLIEDFGSGTPMMLHGREGVITEDQLNEFASQAMSAGTGVGNITGTSPALEKYQKTIVDSVKQQAKTQTSILDLMEEEQDFSYKEQIVREMLAKQEKEQQLKSINDQKEFNKQRDNLYDDILENIKEILGMTEAPEAGGAGAGGRSGFMGAILGAVPAGGIMGAITGAVSGAVSGYQGRPAGAMGGGATAARPPSGPSSDNQGAGYSGGGVGGEPPKRQGGGGGGNMSDAEIKDMIIRHEGIRYEPYQDSLGLWTVGVGHLIGDGRSLPPQWNRKFSHEEVMQLFDRDYEHHRQAAERITGFNDLNGSGQGALTDLTFNMGPAWISKWPKLKQQIAATDVEGAAANLEQSRWYGQVGRRAPEVVNLLRDGVSAADGGVFAGPTSGYPATLHGTEAVIPLKDGNVPAEIPKMDMLIEQNQNVKNEINGLREDMSRMIGELTRVLTEKQDAGVQQEMLAVLTSIARSTNTSAGASEKLVRAAAN